MERVKIHTIIASVAVIAVLVATYYILATVGALIPGLNMGSEGLGWKMLIINLVMVNAVSYVID